MYIDTPRSLENIISEREKKVRDCDKISMQKVIKFTTVPFLKTEQAVC